MRVIHGVSCTTKRVRALCCTLPGSIAAISLYHRHATRRPAGRRTTLERIAPRAALGHRKRGQIVIFDGQFHTRLDNPTKAIVAIGNHFIVASEQPS